MFAREVRKFQSLVMVQHFLMVYLIHPSTPIEWRVGLVPRIWRVIPTFTPHAHVFSAQDEGDYCRRGVQKNI